jgi:antitoxin MazE3
MTMQIAVRLPDELVDFLDQLVTQGEAKSRAAAVTHALERERRRRLAERDAAIYASEKDPDMDRLAAWAAKNVDLSDLD